MHFIRSTWIVVLVILLSRIPFLSAGYGAEEDAWGLRVTAENIDVNGAYEMSRLPGHPLQEIVYSKMWQYGPLAFNLLTLLISTAGIAAFIRTLNKLNIPYYNEAGLALAFTPVIYINSMNAMDYMWSLSFILIAFYFLMDKKFMVAGILLGCAVGCRITSGAMLLPFIYIMVAGKEGNGRTRDAVVFAVSALLTSILVFLPVLKVYGLTFFSYYEHFPLPSFAKNLYKGTIAVWGLPGFVILIILLAVAFSVILKKIKSGGLTGSEKRMMMFCILVIVLYILSFSRLPLKSAFMIPVVPFAIMIIAMNVKRQAMVLLAAGMVVSSFSLGVNLSDPKRGAAESFLSVTINAGSQKVSVDPLIGPVVADYTKQRKIISFCRQVITASSELKDRTVVISGWYLNFIKVLDENNRAKCEWVYYVDEDEIRSYLSNGREVYYLPEQNTFNDLRFKGRFTGQLARPLIVTTRQSH